MPATTYRGRRAVSIENGRLRVTVLAEGGHIAEILDKQSGVNPLWTPPWPSIEPSTYDRAKHPEYGSDAESKLLAGIMGHNLCMDIFGGPSAEEAAAGLTVHGEASVDPYEIVPRESQLSMRAHFPNAQLNFERHIELPPDAAYLKITEVVENISATDRPIAWTQHVTLGPPFLETGATQIRASATKSKVYETDFGPASYLKVGAEFNWPFAPRIDGGTQDQRIYINVPVSGAFTTHLMDPHQETAYFVAFSPQSKLAIGYVWKTADFPWLGIWEENHSREHPPWNGKTLTWGMEFGASPMPETRRNMIERGSLFGMPGYRWIPAKCKVRVEYRAAVEHAESIPETLSWNGPDQVRFGM